MESELGGFRASMTRIVQVQPVFSKCGSLGGSAYGALDEQIVVFRKRQSNVAAILCFGSLLTNEVIASSEGLEVKDVEEYLSRNSVIERQKIVRLLVKEVLVGEDTITILFVTAFRFLRVRLDTEEQSPRTGQNYLLCKGREHSAKGQHDG
jgi:hypothetical protein